MAAILAGSAAASGGERFGLEVTAGWAEVDLSHDVSPSLSVIHSTGADRVEVHDPGFSLEGLRFTASLGVFDGFLAWEREPEAATRSANPDPMYRVDGRVSAEAYDLGLSRGFQLGGRTVIRPSVGLTHLRREVIAEHDLIVDPDLLFHQEAAARFGGWGLVAACELGWEAAPALEVVVGVVQRWAAGTNRFAIPLLEPEVDPVTGEVGYVVGSYELSAKSSIMTFGGQVGMSVRLTGTLRVEGGWRVRDSSYDSGPGTWSGPFVSVSTAF